MPESVQVSCHDGIQRARCGCGMEGEANAVAVAVAVPVGVYSYLVHVYGFGQAELCSPLAHLFMIKNEVHVFCDAVETLIHKFKSRRNRSTTLHPQIGTSQTHGPTLEIGFSDCDRFDLSEANSRSRVALRGTLAPDRRQSLALARSLKAECIQHCGFASARDERTVGIAAIQINALKCYFRKSPAESQRVRSPFLARNISRIVC